MKEEEEQMQALATAIGGLVDACNGAPLAAACVMESARIVLWALRKQPTDRGKVPNLERACMLLNRMLRSTCGLADPPTEEEIANLHLPYPEPVN